MFNKFRKNSNRINFDLKLNNIGIAQLNTIKIATNNHYNKDEDILLEAISLGLGIMEEIATHQAEYYVKDYEDDALIKINIPINN